MMIQVLPIIICWELWKSRCVCIYGNQDRFYTRRMQQQILWHLKVAMDKGFSSFKMDCQWHQLCDILERLRPKIITKMIFWILPQREIIKINTDENYTYRTGKEGIGGIARDDTGRFLFTSVIPVRCSNHNVAEGKVVSYATQ